MKKIIALLLVIVCVSSSLAGCGKDKSKEQIPPANYSGEIKG